MCEKLESLFHQDGPLLDVKYQRVESMHLKGAGDGFVGDLLCSKAMNDHIDRSFENPDESQTSDEYLIIDEANETQEHDVETFVIEENDQKCSSTDVANGNDEHHLVQNENDNPNTQNQSTLCVRKLSVQIDMSSITSVFPSLCSSLYDCKSLSTTQSSEVSSPKHKIKSRLFNKNIPLRKSSSETHLKSEETYKDIGVGLQNMGNTCFVNATLQCLTYTPVFSDILLSSDDTCLIDGNCITCELTKHIKSCFNGDKKAIKPSSILKMLKGIAHHMRWGRQEDAHEFLRYLMDSLHKSCMSGHQKTSSPNESMIQRIFSGELRSQVICEECSHESDTFDPFLDLCLDVKSSTSIIEALRSFVRKETLDGENSYYCARCLKNVRAKKLLTIHKPPHILTIQLKRYGMSEGKVTRHIDFPSKLDLQPYMSNRPPGKVSDSTQNLKNPVTENNDEKKEEENTENRNLCSYNLYAVLVHDGYSTNSGHYYCYIQTKQGVWYCMNDHMVKLSSLSDILSSEAYLLFYCQDPITFGAECLHNKPQFKMVSPSSCSNLSLNSSFNTSSKVMCRGGRLRTSPSTPPLTSSSTTNLEVKPLRSSLNSSKSFSKALKNRARAAPRYRLNRLRLNADKLRAARIELMCPLTSQKKPCEKENNSIDKKTDPVERKEIQRTLPSKKTAITAAKNHLQRCKQPLKQNVQEKAKFNVVPESLLEILKPQKVKQTNLDEFSRSFKIPLKKSSKHDLDLDLTVKPLVNENADHPNMKDELPETNTTQIMTQQTSKGLVSSKSFTVLPSSLALSPTSPSKSTQNKTTIQLRPRKSRSTITSPTKPPSPIAEAVASSSTLAPPAQSPLKTHSMEPNNIEHRKFRKRKCLDLENSSKCPTPNPSARSLRKTPRSLQATNQFVVAPIKLRKVAVTEDGEHLYRIV